MHPALAKFVELYRRDLAGVDMAIISDIYSENIEFMDPAHRIHGLGPLILYFNNMMSELTHCQFLISEIHEVEGSATLCWTMTVAHPKLAGGKTFSVEGMSLLRFDQKVNYHRDYFDLGSMLYEHIPLLGAIVKKIKRGLAA